MLKLDVLDYGYVKLVEHWGEGESGGSPEAGIIEAARQSTQGSFRGWEKDLKLLKYLHNSVPQHSTPFEFAGMIIEVQAPIFVFREWHRHRTQSYNEMSARYAPLPNINYRPDLQDAVFRSKTNDKNKQAGSVVNTDPPNVGLGLNVEHWLHRLDDFYEDAEKLYRHGLNMGVPKELARIVLPVGRYSRMRASANLRNWFHFITLRTDEKAQWEIRQYAEAVEAIIADVFPTVYGVFKENQSA